MSHREIFDSLFADSEKLRIKAYATLPKMIKKYKKEGRFPAWKWVEYTHQHSNNHYLISYYVPSADLSDKPQIKCVAFMEEEGQRLIIQWGHLPYRKYGSIEEHYVRGVSLFCPHFFNRYRERVWNNSTMPFNDLICRYISRNRIIIPIKLNKDIQRKCEEYGEFSYSFEQEDGICFVEHGMEGDELTIGTPNDNTVGITLYYTIVTNAMLSETQKQAIDICGKEYLREYYTSLFEDAMKDTVFRRLNTLFKQQIDNKDD